jgi:AcrR family transcriptional regulator
MVKMKKNDSKYFYTAQLMNQALLLLLEKKDIDFITVTEIANKAGVNRSTFYLHYDNIYELLEETIENLNKQFVSSFNIQDAHKINSKKDAFLITDTLLISYLNFVKTNKRVLRLIHSKPELFKSNNAYKKMYDTIFYPAISFFLSDQEERIYNLEFFTGGISSIINKWLELDCLTDIDYLVEIIKKCI